MIPRADQANDFDGGKSKLERNKRLGVDTPWPAPLERSFYVNEGFELLSSDRFFMFSLLRSS